MKAQGGLTIQLQSLSWEGPEPIPEREVSWGRKEGRPGVSCSGVGGEGGGVCVICVSRRVQRKQRGSGAVLRSPVFLSPGPPGPAAAAASLSPTVRPAGCRDPGRW